MTEAIPDRFHERIRPRPQRDIRPSRAIDTRISPDEPHVWRGAQSLEQVFRNSPNEARVVGVVIAKSVQPTLFVFDVVPSCRTVRGQIESKNVHALVEPSSCGFRENLAEETKEGRARTVKVAIQTMEIQQILLIIQIQTFFFCLSGMNKNSKKPSINSEANALSGNVMVDFPCCR